MTENVKPPEKRIRHKQIGKLQKDWFQAREIYAWFLFKSGKTRDEIGKELKLGTRQVTRLTKRIEYALTTQFPLKDYQDICFVSNVYKALDNVGKLLHRGNIRMTIEFLKGMGIFKEYVHRTEDKPKLTREELERRRIELFEDLGIGKSNGTTPVSRLSPTAFSQDLPPQHEGGST